jgi:hypothetical protein
VPQPRRDAAKESPLVRLSVEKAEMMRVALD